jgi:hypothetical protein
VLAGLVGVEGGIGAEDLLRDGWFCQREQKAHSRCCEHEPLHDPSSDMATLFVAAAEKRFS